MRKFIVSSMVALSALAAANTARATILTADFNDLTTGTLSGKAGGTGWSGNWSGSAATDVVAGDLTSTLYNVPQSGTPQKIQNLNNNGIRQSFRSPSTSPTGTVWFSLLALADSAQARAGLTLNTTSTVSPFDVTGNNYAYFVGGTLNYSFGAGTAGTLSGFSLGTHLLVGKLVIAPAGGNDSLTLWADPNLIANPDINTITPAFTSPTNANVLDSITIVGALMARAVDGTTVTGTAQVDNIRFSDGGGNSTTAFNDVTNVPEPTGTAALALAAALGLFHRRR
jgi:hypothetical protein